MTTVLGDAVHDSGMRTFAASAAVAAGGALAAGKLVRERALERGEIRERRSYRLLAGEGVADGVRRIARSQLDLAIELLEMARAEICRRRSTSRARRSSGCVRSSG